MLRLHACVMTCTSCCKLCMDKQVKKEILWCGLPSGGSDSKAERARQEKARLRSKLESHHGFTQVTAVCWATRFKHSAAAPVSASPSQPHQRARAGSASPEDPCKLFNSWSILDVGNGHSLGVHVACTPPHQGNAGMTLVTV